MKRFAALLILGVFALATQSVASMHLRPGAFPDLILCLTVALALQLSPATALGTSALLGYGADLLSGALLGQHAVLRAITCLITRLANRRLDLHRALPVAIFVAAYTLVDAGLLSGLTHLFAGRAALDAELLLVLATQALANGLAAPVVLFVTRELLAWTAPDESPRRSVRLEPRRPVP